MAFSEYLNLETEHQSINKRGEAEGEDIQVWQIKRKLLDIHIESST